MMIYHGEHTKQTIAASCGFLTPKENKMLKEKINEYNKLLKEHYSHLFTVVKVDAEANVQANDLAMFGAAKEAILETVLDKYNINLSEVLLNTQESETAEKIQNAIYLSGLNKRKLH